MGYAGHACVIAPCLVRPRARRSFPVFRFAEGACGTTGRNAAPAAPALCAGSRMPFGNRRPCAFQHTGRSSSSLSRTGRRKADLACVPHANGLFGLLHVPGRVATADTNPVRAMLSPGHALGPSPVSPASGAPSAPFRDRNPSKSIRSPASLRTTASRCHVPATNRAAPLIGAGYRLR